MADDQKENDAGTQAVPPKKSPIVMILVLIIAVMILGGGGFIGYTQFIKKNAPGTEEEIQAAESQPARKKEKGVRIVVPLNSFIVNLLDKAGLGKRYLKVTVELEVGSEEDQLSIDSHKTQLRDTILLLLSGLSFTEVNTIEGKLDLKQTLLYRINQTMGGGIVHRIYFTEFVVQ